jgi:hypothetical protein
VKPRHYCLFLLLAAVNACYTPDKPGSGLYFYYPVADGNAGADTVLSPSSFMELRPDGTYSQDFGHYDYGSWMLKDNRLYLTNQRHRTYIYLVQLLNREELDVNLDGGRIGHFKVHPMPSSRPEKDPFSGYNNQWRIPARHRESDAEIRKRLVNHFQFWETYFTWALDKDTLPVNISGTPSPLKIYGNGFGLKHYSDLPAEWVACFYDTADCHKADTLTKHTFRRHEIKWPKTDNDLKKLISGVSQLQEWFK